jgi:hypothetical protein
VVTVLSPVESVKITNASLIARKGVPLTLTAAVTPADGVASVDQGVTWQIDGGKTVSTVIVADTGVLTVDETQALDSKLTVRATSTVDTAKYITAQVTVLSPVDSVKITNAAPLSVATGVPLKLTAAVTPAAGVDGIDQGVTWQIYDGKTGANTAAITAAGELTVTNVQKVGSKLIVRAVSKADSRKYADAAVTVTGGKIVMDNINLPFSGEYKKASDSVIDLIKENADHEKLSLTLKNTTNENLAFDSNKDILSTGLVLTHTGTNNTSPALVTIDGSGRNIKLTQQNTTTFITVGSGVTLTLKNIAFDCANNDADTGFQFIKIESGGHLIMETDAYIRDFKTSAKGGGVYVNTDGTFTMSGGEISGNNADFGGGVYVNTGGMFTMTSGTISGNTASWGGGVYTGGTFTMSGGNISRNTGYYEGGGVYVKTGGTFTMTNGTISGNTADSYYRGGGGVYVNTDGTFTMKGGEISGNIAHTYGGGVYVYILGKFTKTGGGYIYGSDVSTLKNTARNGGHVVYVESIPYDKIRNNTAYPEHELNERNNWGQ